MFRFFWPLFLCGLLSLLPLSVLSSDDDADKAGAPDNDARFQALDTNKDGVVSYDEYMQGWLRNGADSVAFDVDDVDANKDGKITWQELYVHFPQAHHMGFHKADKNKDGKLTPQESMVLFRF